MEKLRTPKEARAWLEYQGISIAQWARDNNLQDHLGVETTKPGKLKTERRGHERRAGVQA